MKIVRSKDLEFVPSAHDDPSDPGALKKVLLQRDDLPEGRIQMINYSKIPVGKAFNPHYHEGMVEVFIILSGRVKAKVNDIEEILETGDLLLAETNETHTMENLTNKEVLFLAIGIVTKEGGQTVKV